MAAYGARSRQKAARTSDAIPATVNVLASDDAIAGPVLSTSLESTIPSQFTNPLVSEIAGTFVQSIGMKMNGQLAAIQPIVPQTRMNPKSFWASLIFANAMELVTDIVGTKKKQCSNIRPKNGQ